MARSNLMDDQLAQASNEEYRDDTKLTEMKDENDRRLTKKNATKIHLQPP
jgi:hypothetical protein